MKEKILIGVICFIVGAGAYYLYENNFSHSSKVEKCSDTRFYNYIDDKRRIHSYDEYFVKTLPGFLKTSYKNKLKDTEYLIQAQYCEEYAKKYPVIFKKEY